MSKTHSLYKTGLLRLYSAVLYKRNKDVTGRSLLFHLRAGSRGSNRAESRSVSLQAEDEINRHVTGAVNDCYYHGKPLFRKPCLIDVDRCRYYCVMHHAAFACRSKRSKITHWGGISLPLFYLGCIKKKGFNAAVLRNLCVKMVMV